MPWPDFSELSFGYGFLREFERKYTPGGIFPAAPDFITQSAEATAGYDVSVLDGSTPVFFQFKRSFVLSTGNAREIKNGDFPAAPVYRMHLRSKDSYRQHRALQDLETSGQSVFYVTSQIAAPAALSTAYLTDTVVGGAAAIFAPNAIIRPNLTEPHHLCFRSDQNHAYLYSQEGRRQERKYADWEAVVQHLGTQRASAAQNRQALAQFVEAAATSRRDANRRASRFKDDVARASVMAFLLLDLQLTFFR